jgi:hypothetical protein
MKTGTYRLTPRDLEARARSYEREARVHEVHERYAEAAECRAAATHYRLMAHTVAPGEGSNGTDGPG